MKLQNKKESYETAARAGFTLLEIMIVVTVIGLLAAIAIPNMIQARATSQTKSCINNLRQIDAAIQQWALENNQGAGALVTAVNITPYLGRGTGSLLGVVCPTDTAKRFDTSYSISTTDAKPVCQIIPGPGPGTHSIN
jgi:prepilin-type N-terminal cleavage/methylation domain-containing protein